MNEVPIFTVNRGELYEDTMPRHSVRRRSTAARKALNEAAVCTSLLSIFVVSFGSAAYFAGGGQ